MQPLLRSCVAQQNNAIIVVYPVEDELIDVSLKVSVFLVFVGDNLRQV